MPESGQASHPGQIALIRTPETTDADVARMVKALESTGIRIEVVRTDPPLVSSNGGARPAERASVTKYAAVAVPGLADLAAPGAANTSAARFVQAMIEAGKPVLHIRVPPRESVALEGSPSSLGFKQLCTASWDRWNAIYAPRLGAALAYYTLLSLAPLLVLIVSIAGVFFRRTMIQSGLIWQVQNIMGDVGTSIIKPVLEYSKSTTGIIAGILSILTLLVGASGVFLELRDALDTVWGVRPQYGSGLWSLVRERLFAFLMVLGTGMALSLSLLLTVVLSTPIRFLLRFVPSSGIVSAAMGICVSVVILTSIFAVIYKVVPDIRIGWGDVWIGALVTAVLFTAGKFLIGLYLAKASVGSPYAAAGSLIVFLTWVYYSVQIFLFGAEFTHEYALRHGSYSKAAVRARRARNAGLPHAT